MAGEIFSGNDFDVDEEAVAKIDAELEGFDADKVDSGKIAEPDAAVRAADDKKEAAADQVLAEDDTDEEDKRIHAAEPAD